MPAVYIAQALQSHNKTRSPSTRNNIGTVARFFVAAALATLVGLAIAAPQAAQPQRSAHSTDSPSLRRLDAIVKQAIAEDEIPGAVLVVGHRGRIVYRKAFGVRALLPQREPMTLDTIFDLASLTKVVATAPAVMLLFEQGKVRLNDPVAKYIPEFAANGKEQITVRQLLTHTSGLRPDPLLPPGVSGADAVLHIVYEDSVVAPPGARFLYSDCNYIVLAELVRRTSGLPLDQFAARHLFLPLGMRHTRFLPPSAWFPRIAPTEEIDLPERAHAGSGRGRLLRGTVHDPAARAMGGVAGDAGLFSTADDLALYCQLLLDGGRIRSGPLAGRRLMTAATLRKMTTPQTPPWSPSVRGLGWDIDTTFSANRGELFPSGSYGHTGFTGTSLWLDPASQTFVILLSNSVHPYRRPAISSLRSKVATAVAAALGAGDRSGFTSMLERAAGAERPYGIDGVQPRSGRTLAGIDVLEAEGFAPLQGKRVGLITNQTGVDRAGRRTIDVLASAPGIKLVAIFSPEHGIVGRLEDKVASGTDPSTGLPIYSLYGETRRPTSQMLDGLDALVYDIQDAGVRFYTYITTMGYALEEAARHHIAFFVLDRPDPLDGETIEGPMLDPDKLSFVGYFPLPVRYGMSLGELARMFDAENRMGAELKVIALKDWRRRQTYEFTGLTWIPPSPNLRSLNAALLYPGIEILQSGGVAVGRGTDTPFEWFGAPWIHSRELAEYLNGRFVPGVRFVPAQFTPSAGLYKDQLCQAVAIVITDRPSLNSMLMGLEIVAGLAKLYPGQFALDRTLTLLGNQATLDRLKHGDAPTAIVADWADELAAFRKMRERYLLYR